MSTGSHSRTVQPPSVSMGPCMTPVAQDVPRPVTTGMRSAPAISRAWLGVTAQQIWSFTKEGASSQSSVLSGDLCSVPSDFEPSVLDTEVEEPMKDCSICVLILQTRTQSIYVYIYRYIQKHFIIYINYRWIIICIFFAIRHVLFLGS